MAWCNTDHLWLALLVIFAGFATLPTQVWSFTDVVQIKMWSRSMTLCGNVSLTSRRNNNWCFLFFTLLSCNFTFSNSVFSCKEIKMRLHILDVSHDVCNLQTHQCRRSQHLPMHPLFAQQAQDDQQMSAVCCIQHHTLGTLAPVVPETSDKFTTFQILQSNHSHPNSPYITWALLYSVLLPCTGNYWNSTYTTSFIDFPTFAFMNFSVFSSFCKFLLVSDQWPCVAL